MLNIKPLTLTEEVIELSPRSRFMCWCECFKLICVGKYMEPLDFPYQAVRELYEIGLNPEDAFEILLLLA